MQDSGKILEMILESEEFYEFYSEFIAPSMDDEEKEKSGDIRENYLQKVRSPECRMAILGIQGSGKSSLLNALLFQDEILPVAVEETTCIPTMIRRPYDGEEVGAEVHYLDGKVEEVPLKREFLAKIVDNKYNPSNIMGAAYVLCKMESALLKEGFVFVDLPGVGSLTEQNEETTMKFLKDTNVGIFLLRTVPPITQSEAGFIRIAWPMIQDSLFVQNLWKEESDDEIKSGMKHNEGVLSEIAEERGAQMPQNILPVNVSMALRASMDDDEEAWANAGAKELRKSIRQQIRGDFVNRLHQNTAAFFTNQIVRARRRIKERLQILQSDHEQILEKFNEEKERYNEHKSELENKVISHCQEFRDRINDLKINWLPDELNESVKKVISKIEETTVENFKEEDFRQMVREEFSNVFQVTYKELREQLSKCASDYVDSLSETLQNMASLDSLFGEELYSRKKDKKDPNAASGWSIALSGGVAPLILTGPAGWSILGGSLLAGGIVRWISGATARKRILRGLRKAINDSKNKVKEDMLNEISLFFDSVVSSIQQTVHQELKYYEKELERIENLLNQEEENQEQQVVELEEKLKNSKDFIDFFARV